MQKIYLEKYHQWILIVAILLYSLIVYYSLYTRYIFFEMKEPTDSATYMQVAWSIVNSIPFTTSIQENLIRYFPYNFLGDQLMFTLSFISPFLLFFSSAKVFLIIQIFIISSGAFFLYKFAYYKLKTPWIPLLVTICYLVNPATFLSFKDFGFRAETIFIPCIFSMFFFCLKIKLH